jgi:hypothetical protein
VPLQTAFGKADSEKYVEGADYGEDGEDEAIDDVAVPHADAELENRPSVEEMVARYDVPGVQYETRAVRCRTGGPIFQGFKPCADESFTREMKIPVSGIVDVFEYPKGKSKSRDDEADDSIAGYRQHYKDHHAPLHWPEPKRKTRKQIGVVGDRKAEQELGKAPRLLNVADVDRCVYRKFDSA